ncbi:hypothetical protein ACWDSJ_02715 [Nocardia sp. NPDC003482]
MSRDAERPTAGIEKWIGVVAAVLAPTTLITGLAYYFGLVEARKYYGYFGLDANALGLTNGDYVTRSVGVLYPPAIASLVLVWVVISVGALLRRAIGKGRRRRVIRWFGIACLGVGAVLLVRGVLGVTAPALEIITFAGLTPGALAVGAGLVLAGLWILAQLKPVAAEVFSPTHRRVTLGVAATAIVLALFWLTNIYATWSGLHGAERTAAGLWRRETVVELDTKERLYAPPQLVSETRLPDAEGQTFRYRYRCLRVLEVWPDRVVLVPAKWTPELSRTSPSPRRPGGGPGRTRPSCAGRSRSGR